MAETLKTTLETFKDALTASSALSTWCQAIYGRQLTVYVNMDARNPPGEADCPYILIRPVAAIYGRGARDKTMQYDLLCCVNDETEQINAEIGAEEYSGVQAVIDFLDLAVAAIAATDTGNALLQDIQAEFETIEFFPFFMAGCPLTLVEPFPLGATRTTL
jgi:hypothetical protein